MALASDDRYDPKLPLSTITGCCGDALIEMRQRGEKIDDRVMHLYLDLVVAKLKTAASIDQLAASGVQDLASPND